MTSTAALLRVILWLLVILIGLVLGAAIGLSAPDGERRVAKTLLGILACEVLCLGVFYWTVILGVWGE